MYPRRLIFCQASIALPSMRSYRWNAVTCSMIGHTYIETIGTMGMPAATVDAGHGLDVDGANALAFQYRDASGRVFD